MSSEKPATIEVRPSRVHGNGVFAAATIAAGAFICDYKGELIGADEAEVRDAARRKKSATAPIYIFRIDDENFLDATNVVRNNPARFINHSCDDNCEARWDTAEKRMKIFATREIPAGAEIFLDYGFELSGFFERPCHCGSKDCCGFVVAKFLRPALLKKIARHARARNKANLGK
ncbi:MAG: SET domain-containing protein-lysine N-methyltransferase [Opitutae bacterium]|nr:SET domain-containing protein-lysine N-methyltransferase [Opitutae bacterium]